VQRDVYNLTDVLRGAASRVHETLLIMPADTVLDLDIEAALAAHRANGGAATLILHAQHSANSLPIRLSSFNRVQPVGTSSAQGDLQFTGACILEPQALEYLIQHGIPDDTMLFTALLAAEIPVFGYVSEGYWNPLNSLQAYHAAQRVFLYSAYQQVTAEDCEQPRVRYPSIEGQQIAPGVWVGRNHAIHPNARFAAPLCIGDGCLIGDDVELGPYAVIGPNSVVDDGATVQHSVVSSRTYVGRLVNLADRIVERTTIINPQTTQHIEVVDPFLLSNIVREHSRGLERVLTALVAGLLLLLASPLLVLIALLVALTSGGRIFRREQRVGRRANPSKIAETSTLDVWYFNTQRSDGSRTLFGTWLTCWGIDHLPSLWNVFVGDLNFVGVKPLTLDEAAHLRESWHEKRNDAAAGLTGLWFTQSEPETDLDAVLVADVYYAATRSRRGDLRILLQTPRAWLRRSRLLASKRMRSSRSLPRQMA
ncbi:MAG TPA: sugar transferase, partial [Roseiflexaceae bacterium]|nr:sugar transferase [Roseiflexaceae bacterium]